jgi:NADH dehydrogenase/NADH:ubiquinone oxidoreductase subunit G
MPIMIVDGREINIEKGDRLLYALLDNGIYIPSLCCVREMSTSPASCRLCFVEIEGKDRPVLSCTVYCEDGMSVKTDTPAVRRLQKTAFELFLSTHLINCRECRANKKCELQNMAKFLGIPLKQKRIEYLEREVKTEDNHPYIRHDPFKCVMCGRCVYICEKLHGRLFLSFAGRGLNMKISFFGETSPEKIPCGSCYACVDICPVAALIKK